MEEIDIKKEYEEIGETINDHREYNIKDEKNINHILRIEINLNNIYFILTSSDNIEFIYKTNLSLKEIVNKLELNQIKYSNLELILRLFDEIYETKKIFINTSCEESCNLIIKFINVINESTYEIKLYKKYMNINDKFNAIFREIKFLKNYNIYNNNFHNGNEMIDKINELNNKLDEKNEEINNIIIQKDKIINEMEQKISNQEKRLNELENNNFDFINKNKLIELMNEQIKINEDKINDFQNRDILEEISKLKNKINMQEITMDKNNKFIDDILNNINQIIDDKIEFELQKYENKNNQQNNCPKNKEENINNIIIKDNAYNNKINYEFIQDPKKLKFKLDITKTNTKWGWNDRFEIFISIKDNLEYLVSPNSKNFNLDIFGLKNNTKIKSLPGHKNNIRTIRYFSNYKNKNEYLISGSDDKIIIIWDISDNFHIKHYIKTNYEGIIYSCLLLFPFNTYDDYIITSTFKTSEKNENSATKIYSLNNGNFIKYINNTNDIKIYYLLSWYNNINNKYYIIQFCYGKILINNLFEDELYCELCNEKDDKHKIGFLQCKDNKDYLLSSSSNNGCIYMWDLYDKQLLDTIKTNCVKLSNFLEWNKKYIILCDNKNSCFKIIDLDDNSEFQINSGHKGSLVNIKKINHPIYGEAIISSGNDETLKLWTIEK